MNVRRPLVVLAVAIAAAAAAGTTLADTPSGSWPMAGQNISNTHEVEVSHYPGPRRPIDSRHRLPEVRCAGR